MTRLIDADALAHDLEHDVELCARALDDMNLVGKEREDMQFQKDCKQNCIWYISEQPTVDRWIPVSERLPEESGDYLCWVHEDWVEDFSDWSNPTIVGYDADCEAFGWWVDEYHPVSLGYLDSRFSECPVVAWMPLPEPYRGEG